MTGVNLRLNRALDDHTKFTHDRVKNEPDTAEESAEYLNTFNYLI